MASQTLKKKAPPHGKKHTGRRQRRAASGSRLAEVEGVELQIVCAEQRLNQVEARDRMWAANGEQQKEGGASMTPRRLTFVCLGNGNVDLACVLSCDSTLARSDLKFTTPCTVTSASY